MTLRRVVVGVLAAALVAGLFAFAALSSIFGNMSNGLQALEDEQDCAPDTEITLPAADDGGSGVDTAARAALRAGWSGQDAVVAVAVAGAESGYDPQAANRSSTARGMWQVMLSYHQPKFHGDDWRDPYANARVAHEIFQASDGWGPWVAYTSGAYRKYMDRAAAAVEKVHGGDVIAAAATSTPQAGLRPPAQKAYDAVRDQFAFTGTIGGFSDRNIAGTSTTSKHALGLAIDVMTSDTSVGDPIANYFAGPGYEAYGVENVIWRGRIFNAGRGWHPYTHPSGTRNATLLHFDHVHVDFRGTGGTGAAPAVYTGAQQCVQATAAAGTVVYPVANAASDRHNYGGEGAMWARSHTGTDFSLPCGTPVLAAHGGTVEIETHFGWAGPQMVKISTGPAALTTWYAHMQRVDVRPGDQVQPGQRIGAVGAEGNTTGCHLHFEVHPKNGAIYEDSVDPSKWLATNVGKNLGGGVEQVSARPTAPSGPGLSIASFNILGSSHTVNGGRGRAPGPQRAAKVPGLLARYDVDVAGLQEVQRDQASVIARSGWAMWAPGDGGQQNPIIWRPARYQRVDEGVVRAPYFRRSDHPFPWVRLRDSAGREFVVLNVHNPADVRGPAAAKRARGVATELAFVRQAVDAGLPLFWTGDMNDREPFYCTAVGSGLVHASAGPPRGPGCKAPANNGWGIDWIMGTRQVQFTAHTVVGVREISDHPLVVARGAL